MQVARPQHKTSQVALSFRSDVRPGGDGAPSCTTPPRYGACSGCVMSGIPRGTWSPVPPRFPSSVRGTSLCERSTRAKAGPFLLTRSLGRPWGTQTEGHMSRSCVASFFKDVDANVVSLSRSRVKAARFPELNPGVVALRSAECCFTQTSVVRTKFSL